MCWLRHTVSLSNLAHRLPNRLFNRPPGDHPVVLTVDGPSLGGFVCPATITQSQLWKIGQVDWGGGERQGLAFTSAGSERLGCRCDGPYSHCQPQFLPA